MPASLLQRRRDFVEDPCFGLGIPADLEANGQPSLNADGDDVTGAVATQDLSELRHLEPMGTNVLSALALFAGLLRMVFCRGLRFS